MVAYAAILKLARHVSREKRLNSRSKDGRLFLLSVDGLSIDDFHGLGSKISWFNELGKNGNVKALDTKPLTNAQSIWAEILSGNSWANLDCPGYSRPEHSLNDARIMMESHLAKPLALLDNKDEQLHLTVNMPLVLPKPGRLWLSDGSMPLNTLVAPTALSQEAPFSQYKPRAFLSSAIAQETVQKSVTDCLQVEEQRLKCALKLIRDNQWQVCCLRLTVFDLLYHLIGSDFLKHDYFTVSPQIGAFLAFVDRVLNDIKKELPDSLVYVISAYRHDQCIARLNLNQLLAEGGFLKMKPETNKNRSETFARRFAAVTATNRLVHHEEPVVGKTNSIQTASTLAASPVHGAIYINRKDRFIDGIVNGADADAIICRLKDYLNETLGQQFGSRFLIRTTNETNAHSADMMIYVDGVEMHDLANGIVFDRLNKPKTTHVAEGFVSLPAGQNHQADTIGTIALHSLLKEALN